MFRHLYGQVAALGSAVLSSLLLTGCLMGGYTGGGAVSPDLVSQIEAGVTTKAQILDWFGAPAQFTDATTLGRALDATDLTPEDVVGLPFADIVVYRQTRGQLRAVIFLLFNYFQWTIASDTLVVYFDEEDRVLYYGYSEETLGLL